jgi:anaerobic glycerol-3-phosphate dehydrogenase
VFADCYLSLAKSTLNHLEAKMAVSMKQVFANSSSLLGSRADYAIEHELTNNGHLIIFGENSYSGDVLNDMHRATRKPFTF